MAAKGRETTPRQCPFCGQRNANSKEHVWAQWLRAYPAFEALLEAEGEAGRRFLRNERALRLDPEGRYQDDVVASQHVGELLPFVTVPVCSTCNNGWMSNLETQAQSILHPLISGQPAVVSPDQQAQLAGWAAKCFYAYTSTWTSTNNPFMPQEYLDLAATQRPPGRAFIWMGRSYTPTAQVALGVDPLPFFPVDTPGDQLGELPPGGGEAYLATHSVVFIGHWMPDAMTGTYKKLIPRKTRRWRGLQRIWPPGPAFKWPTWDIPHQLLTAERTHLQRGMATVAVGNLEGMTPEEAERATQAWAAGELHPTLQRFLGPRRVRRLKANVRRRVEEQEKPTSRNDS